MYKLNTRFLNIWRPFFSFLKKWVLGALREARKLRVTESFIDEEETKYIE